MWANPQVSACEDPMTLPDINLDSCRCYSSRRDRSRRRSLSSCDDTLPFIKTTATSFNLSTGLTVSRSRGRAKTEGVKAGQTSIYASYNFMYAIGCTYGRVTFRQSRNSRTKTLAITDTRNTTNYTEMSQNQCRE